MHLANITLKFKITYKKWPGYILGASWTSSSEVHSKRTWLVHMLDLCISSFFACFMSCSLGTKIMLHFSLFLCILQTTAQSRKEKKIKGRAGSFSPLSNNKYISHPPSFCCLQVSKNSMYSVISFNSPWSFTNFNVLHHDLFNVSTVSNQSIFAALPVMDYLEDGNDWIPELVAFSTSNIFYNKKSFNGSWPTNRKSTLSAAPGEEAGVGVMCRKSRIILFYHKYINIYHVDWRVISTISMSHLSLPSFQKLQGHYLCWHSPTSRSLCLQSWTPKWPLLASLRRQYIGKMT